MSKLFFRWLLNLEELKRPMPALMPSDRRLIAGGAAMVFIAMCYLAYLTNFLVMLACSAICLVILLWTHTKRTVHIVYWLWFGWNICKWFAAYGVLEPDAPTFFQPLLLALAGPGYILYLVVALIIRWRRNLTTEEMWSETSHY